MQSLPSFALWHDIFHKVMWYFRLWGTLKGHTDWDALDLVYR